MALTVSDMRILLGWEGKFCAGNHEDDVFCLNIFRNEEMEDGTPILFPCISSLAALQFLDLHEVNILQRSDDGYTLLMDKYPEFDLPEYEWLSRKFGSSGAIDLASDEGITPLSSTLKVGAIDKARILLRNGASVNTYAQIERYGGARVDLPTQAINCIVTHKKDRQDIAIRGLSLLKEFGYKASVEQRRELLERTRDIQPVVYEWIRINM